jgi:hypothetical protein
MFHSEENKTMLWGIITELYTECDQKRLYDLFSLYYGPFQPSLSLVESNKMFLDRIAQNISMKKRITISTSDAPLEEVKEIKQKIFFDEFNQLKNDFETTMGKHSIPDSIDFSDRTTLGENKKIEFLLQETIEKRKEDFSKKSVTFHAENVIKEKLQNLKKEITEIIEMLEK